MSESNVTFENLVVLLDPTSPNGEASARLASSIMGDRGRLHLAVSVTGPEAWPFTAFADAENVSAEQAVDAYLRQVLRRLEHAPATVTSVDGFDLAADLSRLVVELDAQGVVVPAGLAARAIATKRSWANMPYPVIIAPDLPRAA